MSDELDSAASYRARALSLRATANDKKSNHIREQLLAIAGNYERLANVVEGIHISDLARREGDGYHAVQGAALTPPGD